MSSSQPPPTPAPHSAEYLREYRDYWWSVEHLALVARRLELERVQSVLDVGSGRGQWGQLLLAVLSPHAWLTGIDRERDWVNDATARAAERHLNARYEAASAEQMPFPDSSFDLVTCQTLLIHVADPRRVLREMLRVLKPGGVLLAAEPNNLVHAIVGGSPRAEVADIVALMRFQLVCERGKEALGLGNNSLGDLLPGYFAELALREVSVCLSEKVNPLVAPYASRAQRLYADQEIEWARREFWIWDREETHRYFTAGGGTAAEFEELWACAMSDRRHRAAAIQAGQYHSANSSLMYLVSGRKSG